MDHPWGTWPRPALGVGRRHPNDESRAVKRKKPRKKPKVQRPVASLAEADAETGAGATLFPPQLVAIPSARVHPVYWVRELATATVRRARAVE